MYVSINDFYLNINLKFQLLNDAIADNDFDNAEQLYAQIENEIHVANAVFAKEKDKIAALAQLETELWRQRTSYLTAMLSTHLQGRVSLEGCIAELDKCVVALASRVRFGVGSLKENAEILGEQRRLYEAIYLRLKERPSPGLKPQIDKMTGHLEQLSDYMELRQECAQVWEGIEKSWGALEEQCEQLETSRTLPQVEHFADILVGLGKLPAVMNRYANFLKQQPYFAEDIDKILRADIKMLENSASDFYEQLCQQLGAELNEARMRFDAALLENDIEGMRLAYAYWKQVEDCLVKAAVELGRGAFALRDAPGKIESVDRLLDLIAFVDEQYRNVQKALKHPGRSLDEAESVVGHETGENRSPEEIREQFRALPPLSAQLKARLALHQRRIAPIPETSESRKWWINIGLLGLEALSGVRGATQLWREGQQIENLGQRLHQKMIDAIPVEEKDRIQRDMEIIGSVLSDRGGERLVALDERVYQSLIKKLSPAGREALVPYREGKAFGEPKDVMTEYVDSQVRLYMHPGLPVQPPESSLVNSVSRVFSKVLYAIGYETTSHLEARLAQQVTELNQKVGEISSEAIKLIEAADKLGMKVDIEVPNVDSAIKEAIAVKDVGRLEQIAADLVRAEREVGALRERFVTSQQLNQQLVQLKGFLAREPRLPMDDSLFQHLVLPFSGKGTGFEGYTPAEMLDYNLMLAEQWVDAMEANPLCSPQDKSELCHAIFSDRAPIDDPELKVFRGLRDSLRTAVRMTRLMRGDLDTFHREVKAQLDGMREGDSFFLHTGWQTPAGGHSVAVEFINEGKTYAVRVYNQGEGLERHAKAEKGPAAYLTFLEWKNVDPEMIACPAFLGSLAALERGEYGDKVGPQEMYEKIMPMLEGWHSTSAYSDDQTQRLLSVGHCTRTSLEAIYHQHLHHTGRYDRFTMLTRVKALQHMYGTFRDKLVEQKESRELLRMGLQQISHDITGASAMVFSDAERLYIQDLLDQVQRSINAADRADMESQRAIRPQVNMSVPAKVMGRDLDFYTAPKLPAPMKFGQRSKVAESDVDQLILTIRGYIPSPASIAQHISSVVADIGGRIVGTEDDKRMRLGESKIFLSELIDRLPLDLPADPSEPIPFWSEISPEDADRLLDVLVNENWLFTQGVLAPGSGAMRSVDTMALLKVLTLADILVQQLPPEERVTLDHLLLPAHRLFLQNSMPNSELTSTSWQRQFVQLQNYWLQRRKDEDPAGPSFFFTENFVPGMDWQGIEYGAEPSYDEGSWTPNMGHDRGDRLNSPWRAFQWVGEWIEQNPNRPREAFAGRSTRYQTCHLLANPNLYLPKGFSILHELSKDLGMLNAGYKDDNLLRSPPDHFFDGARPKLVVSDLPANEKERTPPRLEFKYKSRWHFPLIKDVSIQSMPSDLSGVQRGTLPQVEEDRQALYIERGGSKLMGQLRKRIPPTERVLYREEVAKLKIPAQLARRLEGCSSVKSLQIAETLALFNENRELLDRPDTRQLLGKLLLEPGLLENHLRSNPAAAEATLRTLSTMFDEHYRLKDALGEFANAAEVLKLYDTISRVAAEIIGSDTGFLDARARWRQLIAQDISTEQRSRFAADLAMSYAEEKSLEPEEIDDIIMGLLLFDMHPLTTRNPLWSVEQQERFSNLPKSLAGLLHQALPDKDDHVLSRAIGRVIPGFTERPFHRSKDSAHLFVDEAGEVEVNLLSGHVWFRNGLPRALPYTYCGRNRSNR